MHYEHFAIKQFVYNLLLGRCKRKSEPPFVTSLIFQTLITFFLFGRFKKYLFPECNSKIDTHFDSEIRSLQLTFDLHKFPCASST